MRSREAVDGEGGTPASVRKLNATALDAAEALVREKCSHVYALSPHSRPHEKARARALLSGFPDALI